MVLYMASNTRPYISFAVYQCARFIHSTKASHDTSVKSIFHYLQGNKYNGLVFNISKKRWWIVMLMHILRDFGDKKIFKTIFLLGVELDLWQLFPIFLYYLCQNYRQRLLFLCYILSLWHCLTLLEHYYS